MAYQRTTRRNDDYYSLFICLAISSVGFVIVVAADSDVNGAMTGRNAAATEHVAGAAHCDLSHQVVDQRSNLRTLLLVPQHTVEVSCGPLSAFGVASSVGGDEGSC